MPWPRSKPAHSYNRGLHAAKPDYELFQYMFSSMVSAVFVLTSAELANRLLRFAFLDPIKWLAPARLRLSLPVAVTFTLLLNPLWDFCLGICLFLEISFRLI